MPFLDSMTRHFLLLAVLLAGCSGDPKFGGPCKGSCDCTSATAPVKCIGEWVCNPQSTCEYMCKSACSSGVSTCGADETCNGVLCSSRMPCK